VRQLEPAGERSATTKPCVTVKAEPTVPPHLLPNFGRPPQIFTWNPDGAGPADAAQRLRSQQWDGVGHLLLVTDSDLTAPGCASVYGYADPRRRIAIVSTCRLKSPDPRLWRERVAKVAAHELLHLEGRRHCPDPNCVMHPASNLRELDRRSNELCVRCRSPRFPWRAAVAAVALCVLVSLLLDAALQALKRRSAPFSWRPVTGGVAVLYRGAPVLLLAGEREAESASITLNRLFADLAPPLLTVRPAGRAARVESGGQLVIEIDRRSANGQDPLEYARAWVERMNPLIQGKGTASEGCPDCHTYRRGEVLEAAMQRTRFWR
jgi:archaemetzincin